MLYKVLKQFELGGFKCLDWAIVDSSESNIFATIGNSITIPFSLLIEQGFLEEVKETPKPRWKVWDCVVNDIKEYSKQFMKLSKVTYIPDNKIGFEYRYNDFLEKQLRDPTPDELSTYFK